MLNFAITGVAGYIAPRHLQAIKATFNSLLAAYDPHDSVGILDKYFPEADFFTDYERFERFLEKSRSGNKIDYVSICSPNYVHDAHIRLALNSGANAICEKPLVLNPANLDLLERLEQERGLNIYTVMQLRYHPALIALKAKLSDPQSLSPGSRRYVDLNYITSRGKWYHYSWKGVDEKSGGVVTNIGIHLFDLLIWLFGDVEGFKVTAKNHYKIDGTLSLKNADVNWFLSIDSNDLDENMKKQGKSTYRSIKIDGEEIEFTDGFTDLHTKVYEEILSGRGLRIEDARPSIETVYRIRNSEVSV